MPQIKFNNVFEFNSEDSAKQLFANNLLKTQDFKSWKTKGWIPNSFVILETIDPQIVDNIEIGNDCSAFIEVLVANSNDTKPRFQVLLSTSSFMTPSESHNLNNSERIRQFKNDKLSPNCRNDKWNRFKIVCTQPFNKTIPFGISFIRFNSREERDEEMDTNSTVKNFGSFKMNTKSGDEESDQMTGSLFFKRNNESNGDSSKVSMRSSLASAVGLTASPKSPQNSSNTSMKTKAKPKSPQMTPKRVSTPNSSNNTTPTTSSGATSSGSPSPPKRLRRLIKDVPFNQIMAKVVFALSGFVNPKRSELRDKAIQMGAKYRADWDQSCTHLICAFENTPKYNEVLAKKGRIVKQKWIEDCYQQKQRIYWRNYILGKYNGIDSNDSEDEAQTNSPVVGSLRPIAPKRYYIDDDEEEEQQMQEVIGFRPNTSDSQNSDEIYDMETDNESTGAEHNASAGSESQKEMVKSIESKPMDIFKERSFHFYGPFEDKEKQMLTEYIITHNGKISDELSANVRYVLTYSQWNEDFEKVCASNDLLQIVKPKWIHKCIEKSKLVPFQPFVVTYDCD